LAVKQNKALVSFDFGQFLPSIYYPIVSKFCNVFANNLFSCHISRFCCI